MNFNAGFGAVGLYYPVPIIIMRALAGHCGNRLAQVPDAHNGLVSCAALP